MSLALRSPSCGATPQGSEAAVIETGREVWNAGVPLYAEVWPACIAVHGGIDALVDRVAESFSTFVSRDQLIALSKSAPQGSTDGFADFVAQSLTICIRTRY
jgi:hypothetical protein